MVSKIKEKVKSINGASKWVAIVLIVLVPLLSYGRARDMKLELYCEKTESIEKTYKEIKKAIDKMEDSLNSVKNDQTAYKAVQKELKQMVQKLLDLQLEN